MASPGDARAVVVVGGGIAGLFGAYRLARRGINVTVFEASPDLGGLLSSVRVGEANLERFYHHLFTNDRFLREALSTLGVPVDWVVTRTGFVRPGGAALAEFSAPQHLLSFPYLRPRQRLRLGMTLARASVEWARGPRRLAALDDMSAREWVLGWGGEDIYEHFFRPLLEKKFASDTEDVSAAFLVGRLGMRAGRNAEGEKLGYPRGGFQPLIDALGRAIVANGGVVRRRTPVQSFVVRDGAVVGVRTAEGTTPAEAVLLTASPGPMRETLARSGLDVEADRLRALPLQKALTVILGVERPLSPFYWVNVLEQGCPFGAVVDHARLCDPAPYGGPLLYLASYPARNSPLWDMSDGALAELFIEHLRRLFPSARGNEVRWRLVLRADDASLIYRRGLRRLLPPRRAPSVRGLYYAGLFRCYPLRKVDLVGADACATADLLAADMGLAPPPPGDAWLPERLNP